MIRAVVFDLYDTLLYLDQAAVDAARRALAARAGVDPDAWAAIWNANVADRMLGRLGTLEDEFRIMLRQLGADPSSDLVAELVRTETAAWAAAVTLYPEAAPTLAALRARGLRLGLITNASAQAGGVLEQIGLGHCFDAVVLSCAVGLVKPDPAIYRHTCRQLGVTPAEALFVADGAFTELDGAQAVGMVAVKIEQEHQSGDYGTSVGFDHRITRLSEVLELLDGGPPS